MFSRAFVVCFAVSIPAFASTILFSTGAANTNIGFASRPGGTGLAEIEAADDFVLGASSVITSATFTGVITGTSPTIGPVTVELYNIFPTDSTTPPSGKVPSRTNSPSDVDFLSTTQAFLITFSGAVTTGNSVNASGISVGSGGNGPVTGQEVTFTVNFSTPLNIPAGHYFFIPQVAVSGGDFYWLSASNPIQPPGIPFTGDLQVWMRDSAIQPDWLRVGTDIVGGSPAPVYNAAFSLSGTQVPESATIVVTAAGLGLAWLRRRSSRR
jgi:hypothetical protein